MARSNPSPIFKRIQELDPDTMVHVSGSFDSEGFLNGFDMHVLTETPLLTNIIVDLLKDLVFSASPDERKELLQFFSDMWAEEVSGNPELFLYSDDEVEEMTREKAGMLEEENRKLRITVENLQEAISLLSDKPQPGQEG